MHKNLWLKNGWIRNNLISGKIKLGKNSMGYSPSKKRGPRDSSDEKTERKIVIWL